MAKEKKHFSLSGSLCELGERILFAPSVAFRVETEEKQENKLAQRLLPYKQKVKLALSKMAEQSGVLSSIRFGIRWFLSLKIRSFAVFFFACGFVQILSFFVGAQTESGAAEQNLLFGVAQMVLTLICSFSRGDVVSALKRSFLHKRILSPLVGMQSWQYPSVTSHDSIAWMLLFGLIFGILSFFLSPLLLLNAFLYAATVLFILHYTEAGLILCAFGGYFLPSRALYFIMMITLLSFCVKCCLGKRSLVFSWMDAPVLLFFLPFLSGSGPQEFSGAWLFFFLYFITGGLVRTVDGVGRLIRTLCVGAILFSLLILSREGILAVFPDAFVRFPDLEMVFFLHPTEQNGMLAAMACPLILGEMRHFTGIGRKIGSLIAFCICVGALAVVKSSTLWATLILGLFLFVIFSYRMGLTAVCVTGLISILAFRLLPVSLLRRILFFFGMNRETLFFPGERAQGFFALLRDAGGWIWIVLFVAVFLWFIYENVRFCRESTVQNLHPLVLGTICSAVIFVLVATQEIPLDPRSLGLFTLLLSVPCAARRAAKREEVRLPY